MENWLKRTNKVLQKKYPLKRDPMVIWGNVTRTKPVGNATVIVFGNAFGFRRITKEVAELYHSEGAVWNIDRNGDTFLDLRPFYNPEHKDLYIERLQ
jgi:hypothetical protein